MDQVTTGIIKQLKERDLLPALVPKKVWKKDISQVLKKEKMKEPLKAVLYLWNDDLKHAHQLAQQIDSPTGRLIHGIMHRREPDFDNAKYWFQRVGPHPVWKSLRDEYPDWDPLRFVDLCRKAHERKDAFLLSEIEKIQLAEIAHLVEFCAKPNE